MHKENKTNNFILQFRLFCVRIWHAFTRVSQHMRVHCSACKQGTAHLGFTSECRLLRHQHHMHVLCYSHERVSYSDTEEKKLLNKVFFAHKKYSRSFITLWLNHWCRMDYFNNVFTTFLGLECGSCIAVCAGSESSRISSKYLHLCFRRWIKILWVWNDMKVRN